MSQFNFKELEKRFTELGKEFQEFTGSLGFSGSSQTKEGFSPKLDAVHEGNLLKLFVDLPGMEKENVKISISANVLTISGSRETDYSDEAEVLRRERSTGFFTRSFSMPGNAKSAGIKASFRNGVLTVSVPLEPEMPESDTIIIE